MTKDDIDKLWHQTMNEAVKNGEDFTRYRFSDLVAAAEREECAKVAEQFEPDEKTSYVMYASKAIRARGNT